MHVSKIRSEWETFSKCHNPFSSIIVRFQTLLSILNKHTRAHIHTHTLFLALCLFICQPACLLFCQSVHLSVCPSFQCIFLSVCPSVCLSICLSVLRFSSSFCLSVHLSVCPSVWLSICLSVHLSVCPSFQFIFLSVTDGLILFNLINSCLMCKTSVRKTH